MRFFLLVVVKTQENADEEVLQRIIALVRSIREIEYTPALFAFAASYDKKTGEKLLHKTGLEVPNDYMLRTMKNTLIFYPCWFHSPFSKNLKEEFAKLAAHNVRFIKILPNSMNFSPLDPSCELFFKNLVKYNMTLITHVGDEHSVDGGVLTTLMEIQFSITFGYKNTLGLK